MSESSTIHSRRVLVPKVWKRPHSTIYGKNVEYGSSLYQDKIGELNGRKFNSQLPWVARNSPAYVPTIGVSSSSFNQSGYAGNPINETHATNYSELLEMTNPNRLSSRRRPAGGDGSGSGKSGRKNKRIDFYDQYADFSRELDHFSANPSWLFKQEPTLLTRKLYDDMLDYDQELGLFMPAASRSTSENSITNNIGSGNSSSYRDNIQHHHHHHHDHDHTDLAGNINTKPFVSPFVQQKTLQTSLLPKHKCQLASSPYGQSIDGRKLSLSSIDPNSYRPCFAHKTSVARASGGEEFEFQDRSSPFYTDRWAGKTIRHFDSDLYSNANLFKSMIL